MLHAIDTLYFKARCAIQRFWYDEEGDVNIVSVVMLIAVAIVLAVLFRKQIANLINNLFQMIQDKTGDLIQDETPVLPT